MDAVQKLALLVPVLAMTACGQSSGMSAQVGNSLSQSMGCSQFQSKFWDQMYQVAEAGGPLDIETLRDTVETSVRNQDGNLARAQVMAGSLVEAVASVNRTLADSDHLLTREERLANVGKLELGIQDTPEIQESQNRIVSALTDFESARATAHVACASQTAAPVTDGSNSFFQALKATRAPAAYGAAKVLTTAYQQCRALSLDPMTKQTPAVQGISIVGQTSTGGKKRVIASLSQVQKTHYYIQSFQPIASTCTNVPANPLIYDFGGKPYATSDPGSPLNFFKNAGSGTAVLGVDCSGYIFSSLASAGLKLRSDRPIRAVQVYATGSDSFYNPKGNGLDCLQPIVMNGDQTIQAGDIVGGSGHVIMIESVEADPFGIASAKSIQDCSKITAANFHFTIAQSSPSQGGIGINRYRASDYLATSATYRNGLETYAKAACTSKFQRQTAPSLSTIRIVRHTGTPQCQDAEISLQNSSCVSGCQL